MDIYLYNYIRIFILQSKKLIYPRLRQQPATALDARSSSQVGSQNPSSWAPKSTKLGSKIKKNQSWEVSGGILGPSWPQDPPKTKIELEKPFLGALLGIHFGGQNPPKSNKNRSWIALGNLSDIEA